MSFDRIYGVGRCVEQALIFSKINEIECGAKTDFLKVTKAYLIDKPNNLDVDNLELKIIFSALEPEELRKDNKHYRYLEEFYGKNKLDRLLDIYKTKNDEALCIRCDNSNSSININNINNINNRELNVYKFLF